MKTLATFSDLPNWLYTVNKKFSRNTIGYAASHQNSRGFSLLLKLLLCLAVSLQIVKRNCQKAEQTLGCSPLPGVRSPVCPVTSHTTDFQRGSFFSGG